MYGRIILGYDGTRGLHELAEDEGATLMRSCPAPLLVVPRGADVRGPQAATGEAARSPTRS